MLLCSSTNKPLTASKCADLANVNVCSLSQVFLRELGVVEQGMFTPVYEGAQRLLVPCDHPAISQRVSE